MCGIAGLLCITDGVSVDPDRLRAMADSMAHRGPDGDGAWVAEDRRVGLAHRRLAIVDLSPDAAQPMSDAEGRLQVTFNGEIYNHLALRAELQEKGHRFRTDHSDTEVLIHGYREWGLDGLVGRLEGMFAFALWDADAGRLGIARDRIGIKPVYFTEHGGTFRFASEIKAILSDPAVPRDVEPAAVNHYLSFMISPAPLTMFSGIYKLPAGYVMEIGRGGRMESRRYWDATPGRGIPASETAGLGDAALEDYYVTGIRSRLERAIEKRMMSDVPFGVFLSGGIDSSANASLMSRLMDRPVETFTVGFKDHPRLNETDYARRVAEAYGTNHHEVLIDERDMTGYLDGLVHHQDEPIADWVCIPLYFVSKLARDSGVTVVQVGEGSDEQFCGYRSYMLYLKLLNTFWKPWGAVPPPLRKLAARLAAPAAGWHPQLARVADFLERRAQGHELFWGGAHAFWNVHKKPLVTHGAFAGSGDWPLLERAGLAADGMASEDSGAVIDGLMRVLDEGHPGTDQLNRMIYGEFKIRLPELLLMRVDKITMSTSVEGRVPFLDHDLVEFTMDIPMEWKVRGGEPKYLLKKALRGIVPDEVIDRPKMGFNAPMAEWLRGEFGGWARDTVLGSHLLERGFFDRERIIELFAEHRAGKRNNALHLWILTNLAAWHDHWIAGGARQGP